MPDAPGGSGPEHPPEEVSALLDKVRTGDKESLNRLIAVVYDELHALAQVQRRKWHGTVSINTTALVNEAYLKLVGHGPAPWRDRSHFMAVAATAMRQILIDHARRQRAQKRGGDQRPVTFGDLESVLGSAAAVEARDEALLLLDESLTSLAAHSERQMRIVECRFFGGMTIAETGEALGISPATVKRGWEMARVWLYRHMREAIEA